MSTTFHDPACQGCKHDCPWQGNPMGAPFCSVCDDHWEASGQACRDCGELFPYSPDADYCPRCVAAGGFTSADAERFAAMDRGEVTA